MYCNAVKEPIQYRVSYKQNSTKLSLHIVMHNVITDRDSLHDYCRVDFGDIMTEQDFDTSVYTKKGKMQKIRCPLTCKEGEPEEDYLKLYGDYPLEQYLIQVQENTP